MQFHVKEICFSNFYSNSVCVCGRKGCNEGKIPAVYSVINKYILGETGTTAQEESSDCGKNG